MGRYRIAYRLLGVDHMDVEQFFTERDVALAEMLRLTSYKDLVKLTFTDTGASNAQD